jgi:hypothetical protein
LEESHDKLQPMQPTTTNPTLKRNHENLPPPHSNPRIIISEN